jgi:hypothetical protein
MIAMVRATPLERGKKEMAIEKGKLNVVSR